MIFTPISIQKFAVGWLPTLAATAVIDPAPRLADAFAFDLGGYVVPPVTCLLGLLGVVMARPLVRKREGALSLPEFVLVSAILWVLVELWILDTRPSALFAFVIAIGVGFSGYSLLELVGDQVREWARRLLSKKAGSEPGNGA